MEIFDLLKSMEYLDEIVQLLLTAALAWFTWLLYKETEKTRIQNVTPQISIYFYPMSPVLIGMRIENTSRVDAKNIIITCSNNNRYKDKNHDFIYSEKLSKKISYLPPHQAYSFRIGYYGVMKDEVFNFTVSFTDIRDKNQTIYPICIDMSFLKRTLVEKAAEEKLATAVENFRNDFLKIIGDDNGKKGIRVHQDLADQKIRKLEEELDFYREQLEELEARDSKD